MLDREVGAGPEDDVATWEDGHTAHAVSATPAEEPIESEVSQGATHDERVGDQDPKGTPSRGKAGKLATRQRRSRRQS